MLITVSSIISATDTASSLKKFIEGGELLQVLDKLRDSHLESARECLRNAKLSNNPRREYANATNNLIVAKNIVRQQRKGKGHFHNEVVTRSFQYERFITSLIVVCYQYLDEPDCCLQYITELYELYDEYLKFDGNGLGGFTGGGLIAILNPANALTDGRAPYISDNHIRDLEAKIKKYFKLR
jgi:hypothetical protein